MQQHLLKKAELFNTYFYYVFRPPKPTEINEPPCFLLTSDLLSDITISEEEVVHHLSNLDPSKAPGPDNIPGHILKQCRAVIAPSLCSLFNQSLQTGTLPSEWKSANVTPVHKKTKNNLLLTTDLYPCFPSSAKSWSHAFVSVSSIMFRI